MLRNYEPKVIYLQIMEKIRCELVCKRRLKRHLHIRFKLHLNLVGKASHFEEVLKNQSFGGKPSLALIVGSFPL